MNRWDMELADTREAIGVTRSDWTCDHCHGKIPVYLSANARYCGDKCRKKAWRRGRDAWKRRDRRRKREALLAGHK